MNSDSNISIANALIEKEQKYWSLRIDKDITKTKLPFKGNKCKNSIEEKKYYLSEYISINILRMCNKSDENIFTFMYSVLTILLFKYGNEKKITIETNILKQENISNIINKIVPLIEEVNSELTFKEMVIQSRKTISEAYENANYPIDKIYDIVSSEMECMESPLTDVILVCKELHQEFENEKLYKKIKITVSRDNDLICLNIKYDKDLYNKYYIEELVNHFNNILISISNNGNIKLKDIDILDEDTKHKLLKELNSTEKEYPKNKTIVELFEEQVEKTPNNLAAIFEDKQITYRELNKRANSVARELLKNGIKCKDAVGLIVDKSIEMIVGIIAILKLGAAYVPIDYKFNQERINFMIDDAKVKVILGEERFLSNINVESKKINIDGHDVYMNEKTNLNIKFDSSNMTYIIYTSGSTGKPKGTSIRHYSVIRVVKNTNYIDITSDDSLLQLSSYVFDGSVFDIYGALLNGARLIIPTKEDVLNLQKLSYLIEEKVNVLFITTALFNSVVDININCLKNTRKVLFGGERVSIRHAKKALESLGKDRLIHVYGPTESTVFSTYYPVNEINEEDITVPIGKALANTELYVLGKDNSISPIGIPGELYIGGDGLAPGYLNNESLTNEKFIDNPYFLGEKMYRTGDLVKILPSGDLEFIDRIDKQVKIRGFRIELGEIEAKLLQISGIKSVIVMDKEKEDSKYLCAYYLSEKDYTVSEIREELKKLLPYYMIPSYFIRLEEMPLTINGKVDKTLLPEPEDNLNTGVEYEAPRNGIEEILVEVWKDTLNTKRIGINDDFFSLGGDSIKAIQLISRTKAKGYNFEVKNLYENTTIKELSKYVKRNKLIISQETIIGETALTPIQQWFFKQNLDEEYHFNQSLILLKEERFNIDILKKVFNKIILHHDALRMVYSKENGTIVQKNRGIEGKLYDFYLYESLEEKQITQKCNEIQSSIKLEEGPLVKVALFKGSRGDYLLIVIHHLIIDGISWRILLDDFRSLYREVEEYGEGELHEKTTSFQEWSLKQLEYAEHYNIKREVEYWNSIGKEKYEKLPNNKRRSEVKFKDLSTESFRLTKEETEKLLKKSNRAYNTEINDLLLSALALTMSKWTGNKNTLINLEGHGREAVIKDVDISRTIGWFTSQYPVVLKSYETVSDTLKNTKDMLRKIPNKGIGYGIIKYLSKEKIKYDINPEISFNYLGQIDNDEKNDLFGTSYLNCGNEISGNNKWMYSLDFSGIVEKNKLIVYVKYNEDEFNREKIRDLAKTYKENILNIINHCVEKKIPEKTVSDISKEDITLHELILSKEEMNNIKNIYKLSPMQEGILYHTLAEGKGLYNVIMDLEVEGYIDIEVLDKAFNKVIERHDVLRTKFDYSTFKENMQIVYTHRNAKVEYIDISNEKCHKEEYIDKLINQYSENGFDLIKDVLIRLVVVKMDLNKYTIILYTHHILMDGWCIGLIVRELFKIYSEIKSGDKSNLNEAVPYLNYIEWLKNKDILKAEKYWKDYLDQYNQITKIPFKKENKGNKKLNKKVPLVLDEEKTKLINSIASENKITVNTIIQSIWAILLQKYNNSNDIVYGYVVSGRNPEIKGVESILGLFISTIPLRIKFVKNMSYKELLISVNNATLKHNNYDYLGLAQIQNLSEVKSNLINNILVFENYPIDIDELDKELSEKGNLKIISNKSVDETNYDFNIIVSQGKDIAIDFKYNEEAYSTEDIIKIKSHFNNIVNEIVKNIEVKIQDIEILGEDEKNKLLIDFNDTKSYYPRNKSISELFENQAKKTPNNISIVFEDIKLTYKEFNERSNSLAGILRNKGVGPDVTVGLMVERSIEMMIGIMAIIKAGGAYLPIDPHNPQSRINYIIKDSNINLLLTVKDIIQDIRVEIETLDLTAEEIYKGNLENLPKEVKPDNLAYIIYTSGSTGKPKGVKIKQHSAVNFLNWMQKMYPIDEGKSYLLKTNYVFDISVSEIFGWFMGGGSLVILKNGDEKDPNSIIQAIKKDNITHVNFTSSMFNGFLENLDNVDDISSLQYILTGGEALKINFPLKTKEILERNIKIENLYGPTEATVYTTYYSLVDPTDYISIGKPINNVKTYILDNNNKLVPIGVTGELCISGEGVAVGYVNNVDLTEEKFIDNQFEYGKKLYKTGDLARWCSDGNIDYLGRIDNQVKIRGFRVELGEIETKLLEIQEIKYAAVIDKEKKDNVYLCAYYVSDNDFTIGELREKLKVALPDYMIPSFFIKLDKVPITANGKLDKKSLPEPDVEINTGVGYEAPGNEIENQMVEIFEKLLDLQRLGVRDNLFEVGLNSIISVRICNELKKVNIDISIKDIFYYGNIRNIYLNCIRKEDISSDEESKDNNEIIDLNINEIKQSLIDQINKFKNTIQEQNIVKEYYTSAIQKISKELKLTFSGVVMDFDYKVNMKLLRKSIVSVINAQGLLRSIIVNSKNDMKIQEYEKLINIEIPYLNLEKVNEEIRENIMDYMINGFCEENLENEKDIFNRILYKIIIVKLSDKKYKLYMPANHLIFDGMSNEIIKTNILRAYFSNGTLKDDNLLGYYEYVNQLKKGPRGITEKGIIEKFNLNSFRESFKEYFHKYKSTKLVNTIITINLEKNTEEFIRKSHWEVSLKIFMKILELNFGLDNIPFVLLNQGRSYTGNNYYNTVGEFIDILPLSVRKDKCISLDYIKSLLTLAEDKNINFFTLIYDDEVNAKYKKISEILKNTFSKQLNIPIFNYLGLYDLQLEIDEFTKVQSANSANRISTEINIRLQENKLVIALFCEEKRVFDIKQELEKYISTYAGIKDTYNT